MPLQSLSVSRLTAGALLLMCVAAGYLFAEWWFSSRLQQRFGADINEEVREQLSAAVEECRSALHSRVQDSD